MAVRQYLCLSALCFLSAFHFHMDGETPSEFFTPYFTGHAFGLTFDFEFPGANAAVAEYHWVGDG